MVKSGFYALKRTDSENNHEPLCFISIYHIIMLFQINTCFFLNVIVPWQLLYYIFSFKFHLFLNKCIKMLLQINIFFHCVFVQTKLSIFRMKNQYFKTKKFHYFYNLLPFKKISRKTKKSKFLNHLSKNIINMKKNISKKFVQYKFFSNKFQYKIFY